MLRITSLTDAGSMRTLKLEGKLLAPWTDEVRAACDAATAERVTLRLDLAGVAFVDPSGAELLRELARRNVKLVACSPFVETLIQAETL